MHLINTAVKTIHLGVTTRRKTSHTSTNDDDFLVRHMSSGFLTNCKPNTAGEEHALKGRCLLEPL
jgi:hypothetical protein